ncbi:MAG: alanyl-tRNA synthetase [Gammaproteobacteria bacterium]|nr:alanyl-tRNA synthetase [Gammaproteobacteria bacterium]MDH5651629.1 alanyl-tRNA synthetase [Gammaproteobacteria bacterium]
MLLHHVSSKSPIHQDTGSWLKRLGRVGFLFFLIKGLLWLTLPGILIYFGAG